MTEKKEEWTADRPLYEGDEGGDSVARDEMLYEVGLQVVQAGAQFLGSSLNAIAQMQQANAAAHAARVMATVDHAKSMDQVTVRGAQNGESGDHRVFANGVTTDHQVDGQSVRVNGYEATAVYTSGVGPVQTATAGEAADNISDEDDN